MIKQKRSKTLIVGAIALCASPLGACAAHGKIDGWQAAKFGMTPSQVTLEYPGVAEDASLCKSPPPDLENDCHMLILKKYQSFGQEWMVFFVFSKEKRLLQSVRLGGPTGDDTTERKLYDYLKVALREKFGNGTEIRVDDDDECRKVAERFTRGESVTAYEFYASHKGVRYTVEGTNGRLRLSLNSDPVCKQAPKQIAHGQFNVDIEYLEAGSKFGSP
jgi:hypothetical protein